MPSKLVLIGLWFAALTGVVLLCLRLVGLATEASAANRPAAAAEKQQPAYLPPPSFLRNEPEERQPVLNQLNEKSSQDAEYWGVGANDLGPPIAGLKKSDIQDTFDQGRDEGERRHEALDIMQPRGTPVLAVTTGVVKKLFLSKPGGLTVYQFGRDEAYCFYYAHLDHYAEGLKEGVTLQLGDVLGYVGTTGNAAPDAPHLHLAIFRLGPDKKWWEGTAVNPYPILMRVLERAD